MAPGKPGGAKVIGGVFADTGGELAGKTGAFDPGVGLAGKAGAFHAAGGMFVGDVNGMGGMPGRIRTGGGRSADALDAAGCMGVEVGVPLVGGSWAMTTPGQIARLMSGLMNRHMTRFPPMRMQRRERPWRLEKHRL